MDWGEQGNGGMCVCFVLLARGIALNVLAHKLCKTGPPKLRDNKLAGLKIARVSSGLVVMAAGKDRAMEGVLQGNVDATLVGQNMVIILPVRKMRVEGNGDALQRQL